MTDYITDYVDNQERLLTNRIHRIYAEAERDIQNKMDDFNQRYKAKEAIHLQELKDGKITQEDFDAWQRGQIFQGKQWEAKKDQITATMMNANQIAVKLINEDRVGVFTTSANYMAYNLEHTAGLDFGFGLYDTNTVARLIKDDPKMLPEWKIDEPKDYTWNQQKVNNAITQGIIQGESLDQISKRLSHGLVAQNENTMDTFARTAMTGAQNAGRQTRFSEAKRKDIKVRKEWMATLDKHTRDSHARLDGEKVETDQKFSNGLMYPGDPNGDPREVYNCRCTMVGDLVDYPAEYERYDNIDGKLVSNMTYSEWYEKKGKTHVVATKVLDSATEAEKMVTRDLMAASSLGSGHLEGLDFRFKGRGSLERKIVDKSAKKGIPQDQYAQQITDALRYTNLSDPNTLTEDFFKIKQSLESKGYSMVEVANSLADINAEYRGINTLVQTPKGYTFELQFHTPQSLEIKEINHKLYEEQRLSSTPEAEKERLGKEMINNARSIITPKDVESIVNKLLDKKIKQW